MPVQTRLIKSSGMTDVEQMKTAIANLRATFVVGNTIKLSDIQALTALWNLWITHNHSISDLASSGAAPVEKFTNLPSFNGATVSPVAAGNSGVISADPVQAIINGMVSGLAHVHGWEDDR